MAENITRHLKIFLAWPSDVEEERNRAEEVIKNLNQKFVSRGCYLEMLDWRNFVPPGAGNAEDLVLEKTDPSSWDIFIGILWKRFGSPPGLTNPKTGQPYASGFEVEYEQAHALWEQNERPHLMLYRCTRSIPPETDVEQLRLVQQFFQGIEKKYEVLYKRYDSLDDFAERLNIDLAAVVEKIIEPVSPYKTPIAAFPYSRTFEDIAEQTDFSGREYKLKQIRRTFEDIVEQTDFSGREYELKQIQNILLTDPEASVMVYAPTGMGKTRLLAKLQEVLTSQYTDFSSPSFHSIRLDCRNDEGISTSKDKLLLSIHQKLPQRRVDYTTNSSDLMHAISFQAVDLMSLNRRIIILLDCLELMKVECLTFVRRQLLPDLRKVVKNPRYYPAVIAFGRVHPKEWRGKDSVHFRTIALSPFSKANIDEILRRKIMELNKTERFNLNFPDRAYNEWAEIILNISHGHPRCIVNLVSWLYEQHFAVPTDFDSKELFFSFVLPVIEREILGEDNLAPLEPIEKRSVVAKRLRQVLSYLCIFRLYWPAQLQILADCGLIDNNKKKIAKLDEQLKRTFLVEHAPKQAWFKPHKIIRQLLADALYYQRPEIFTQINQAAYKFYDEWIIGDDGLRKVKGERLQDHDQVYYIVEGLYHHSLLRKREEPITFLKEKLSDYLSSLRGHYPIKYLTRMLADYMLEDEELRQMVQRQGKPNDDEVLVSFVENWDMSKNSFTVLEKVRHFVILKEAGLLEIKYSGSSVDVYSLAILQINLQDIVNKVAFGLLAQKLKLIGKHPRYIPIKPPLVYKQFIKLDVNKILTGSLLEEITFGIAAILINPDVRAVLQNLAASVVWAIGATGVKGIISKPKNPRIEPLEKASMSKRDPFDVGPNIRAIVEEIAGYKKPKVKLTITSKGSGREDKVVIEITNAVQ